jgi:hypothetical protein
MFEQAIEEVRKLRLLLGVPQEQADKDTAALKEAYRRSGERGFWQMMLEVSEKDARARNREVNPFELAILQLGIGKKEQALDSLEKGVANGKGIAQSVFLKSSPFLEPLRAEPRFKELLRKVGLPE